MIVVPDGEDTTMNTNKATIHAYRHIQNKVMQTQATLQRLEEAAELLTRHGWFEENNIERFGRYEFLDGVRDAIGEAADLWGVPATEKIVRALQQRNEWFLSGWSFDVPELLERWRESQSSQY